MTNLFFDFDGTIINSQRRMYRLFAELCPRSSFSYDEYWGIKRRRIMQQDFLQKYFGFTEAECARVKQKWLAKIEENSRLAEDAVVGGMDTLLAKCYGKYRLYLVTNRQDEDKVLRQLENLHLRQLFDKVFVTKQKASKADLIKGTVDGKNDIMVGDTGEDIKTAKALDIKAIAVAWGFLDADILAEYKPDMIFEKVEELESYLL